MHAILMKISGVRATMFSCHTAEQQERRRRKDGKEMEAGNIMLYSQLKKKKTKMKKKGTLDKGCRHFPKIIHGCC